MGTGLMSLENFRIILNKTGPFAKEIHLYNYGEPFLNQNMIDFISLTSEQKIRTVIHSNLNARFFDESEAQAIVKSGLTELSVSIDGATQDTYEKYRIGGNIEKAFLNIRQFVQAKKQAKSETPLIKWSFLINKHNEHQIAMAKQKAKELGVTICYGLMDVWGEEEWVSSYHLEKGKISRLCRHISMDRILYGPERKETLLGILKEKARAAERKLFPTQCLPTNTDTIVLSSKLPYYCMQPFIKLTVNWDGEVMPCCAVSDRKASVGNLVSQDLGTVWNHAKMRKCRMFLLNADTGFYFGSACECGACPPGQLNARS
jgi:MoaA/NifB/PqqE/SkfB family radical SAM enzyme